MNMKQWAEREVEIACKRERKASGMDEDGDLFDYGSACYGSALKAFNTLLEDGHSGMSISFTKNILNRLIEGKPLTGIEDIPESWSNCRDVDSEKDCIIYQCSRMSSLFKHAYKDGSVKYSDIDMHCCVNINNPSYTYYSGIVRHVIDEMFPITMPYYPQGVIKVYCEDFLTDEKNGDYDTVGIFYAVKPDGEKIDINRFFWLGDDEKVEIYEDCYKKLKEKSMSKFPEKYEAI